jgi:hypothetical protein
MQKNNREQVYLDGIFGIFFCLRGFVAALHLQMCKCTNNHFRLFFVSSECVPRPMPTSQFFLVNQTIELGGSELGSFLGGSLPPTIFLYSRHYPIFSNNPNLISPIAFFFFLPPTF